MNWLLVRNLKKLGIPPESAALTLPQRTTATFTFVKTSPPLYFGAPPEQAGRAMACCDAIMPAPAKAAANMCAFRTLIVHHPFVSAIGCERWNALLTRMADAIKKQSRKTEMPATLSHG
jgi:hypothetical protein